MHQDYQKNIEFYNDPDLFHNSMQKLTDVIVYDIFSPPVASRIYVYPSIAAYEVLRNSSSNYKSLAGQLNGLDPIPEPDLNKEYSFPIASIHAFLTVGKDLIFSDFHNSSGLLIVLTKGITSIKGRVEDILVKNNKKDNFTSL